MHLIYNRLLLEFHFVVHLFGTKPCNGQWNALTLHHKPNRNVRPAPFRAKPNQYHKTMLTYQTIKRKNPRNGNVGYYVAPVRLGHVNIDDLAGEMSAESTVTRHDILAVLSSLQQHVIKNLQQGRSVRLGDLGSFHVDITSRPSETEDEVTSENIKAVRVHFRKSGIMKSQFQLTNSKMRFANFNTILNNTDEDDTEPGA
jgi:predicted histone-like DNA-binding protein